MGLHKYIRSLNPIGLYTFDVDETFITDSISNSGYFINKADSDFPPLVINTSDLFTPINNVQFINPALSYIETSATFKSFSNGPGNLYNAQSSDQNGGNYSTFYINSNSIYLLGDMMDYISEITESTYTILFQLKCDPISGITQSIPTYTYMDNITSYAYTGQYSYCYMTGGTDGISNMITVGKPGLSSPTLFYNQVKYDKGSLDNIYFSFNEFIMHLVDFNNSTNFMPYTYNKAGQYISIGPTLTYRDVYLVKVTINKSNGLINITYDKNTTVYSYTAPSSSNNNILKIGYRTYWSDTGSYYQSKYPLKKANFPLMNAKFDNVSFFNRTLTQNEINTIFDLNMDYIKQYSYYGFTQLYDFSNLYRRQYTNYIEDNTYVQNLLGATNLYIEADYSNLSYVSRNNTTTNTYYYNCVGYNNIRCPGYTTNGGSLIDDASYTIMFSFNTTDMSGILFSNSKVEYSSKSFSLLFSGGAIQLWIENRNKISISGYNNGNWHNVIIICNGTSTYFYIDNTLFYTYNSPLTEYNGTTEFGSAIPGQNHLDCKYAMIAYANKAIDIVTLISLFNHLTVYTSTGQVTLNNIALDTFVYVYNRYTGELLDVLETDSGTGSFTYINYYPYTITLVITDSSLTIGKSYIIDPVQIQ